jgi:AraC-like DNA-binding protein
LIPVRTSPFAAVFSFAYDPACAPRGVEDKQFEFDCIVVTTRGQWRFHGNRGRTDIDAASLTAGVAGDTYGCKHGRQEDCNLIVALRPGALDPDCQPLFSEQVLPARASLALVQRAVGSVDDDRFESLIFSLYDDVSSTSRRKTLAAPPRLRMQRAKRFIERHALEQLHLADIARELGLSPFTTVRQFRAATGKTPYSYLLEIRLEHAKRLLEKSEDPIGVIARAVGFDELAHFSRFFKASTGLSPTAYRSYARA